MPVERFDPLGSAIAGAPPALDSPTATAAAIAAATYRRNDVDVALITFPCRGLIAKNLIETVSLPAHPAPISPCARDESDPLPVVRRAVALIPLAGAAAARRTAALIGGRRRQIIAEYLGNPPAPTPARIRVTSCFDIRHRCPQNSVMSAIT
ncbi:hypothetical protein GCM10010528_07640 [Gordonia defluvii]|jgi:hypothetical protein|uniref:Uncharacterized protein n=1 Tax=Gordonia defluvii TaxID=283718 RepID=A0ABP6L344_9ACTN